ncbi:TPA: CS1-pili formation C-terminal domain-containing protein [Vibrio parahaemolyticus]
MMNSIAIKVFIIVLLLSSFSVRSQSSDVPEGFEQFQQVQTRDVKVYVNDDESVELLFNMSFDQATIVPSSVNKLQNTLNNTYASEDAVNTIIEDLKRGVSSSSACKGRRETCVIDFSVESNIQYVLILNNNSIRILVPPALMSEKKQAQRYVHYENSEDGSNSLIMHHQLSVGASSDADINSSYRNESILGLSNGFISSNAYLSSDDSYVDEFSYNYLKDDKRFSVGYTTSSVDNSWNGTALLGTDNNMSTTAMSFGNTSELLYKNKNDEQRLFFSTPSGGRLKVSREDGSPILEENVNAGQNSISYSDLPKGIYTIHIAVYSGESIGYEQYVKVFNTSNFDMNVSDVDYKFSFGYLNEQTANNANTLEQEESYDSPYFFNAKVAYKPIDELILGFEAFNTTSDYFTNAAFYYAYSDNIHLNNSFQYFDDGSSYEQLIASLYGWNFSWERFDDHSDEHDSMQLSNYVYGFGSFDQLSAYYNLSLFGGNAYLNYNKYTFSDTKEVSAYVYSDYAYDYGTLTLGYSFMSFFHSNVDANITYLSNDSEHQDVDDEMQLSLTVSIPLSATAYSSLSYFDTKAYQSTRLSVGNSYNLNEHLDASTEASITKEMGDVVSSLNASVNYSDDQLSGSAFGSIDSDSSRSIYGNLSSTTIVTADDVYQTRHKANSYAVVSNISNELSKQDADFFTMANLEGNGDRSRRFSIDADEVITPISEYKEYTLSLDETSSDYVNKGNDVANVTAFPGTIIGLDVNMEKVDSYISVFNDIEGQAIESVDCKGAGCVSISEVTDGVFKLKFVRGQPFKLYANNQRCFIPPIELGQKNLGENFCMPKFDDSDGGLQTAQLSSGAKVFYLGEFADESVLEHYFAEIDADEVDLFKEKIGSRTFVFAKVNSDIDIASLDKLKEINNYASSDDIDTYAYEGFVYE